MASSAANADSAQMALDVARKHYSADNYDSAIRFCKKSLALNSTPEALSLLQRIEAAKLASATGATSSATETHPSASTTHARHPTSKTAAAASSSSSSSTPAAAEKREFTPAQAALVKRVKACRVTQYYEILGIEKGCTDNDIKKAYRKLALGLHPDKCGAPGAEEAFKMVSKAFQVLSDGNKRAIFDQTGGDPDSRGGGGGGAASPFSRGGGGGGGMNGFGGEELSPEDLFRFFFNGGGGGFGGPFGGAQFGGGGSPFGGGTFQFYGPGGVRMSAGGPRRAANGGAQQAQQQGSVWLQIAPLLILFFFSLLFQLPSLFGGGSAADPDFAFERMPKYSVQRTTSNMGINYFVNPPQFSQHPIYDSFLRENPHLGFESTHAAGTPGYRRDLERFIRLPLRVPSADEPPFPKLKIPRDLAKFERTVERSYINRLQAICRQEIQYRNDRLDRARGFLGFGANWDEIRKITAEKLPRCEELSTMGYNVQYE